MNEPFALKMLAETNQKGFLPAKVKVEFGSKAHLSYNAKLTPIQALRLVRLLSVQLKAFAEECRQENAKS